MKHYLVDAQIIRDRQQRFRADADNERLAQLAQAYRPGLGGRILAGIGGWMIARGTRLKERYEGVASYQLPVASYQTPARMKAE